MRVLSPSFILAVAPPILAIGVAIIAGQMGYLVFHVLAELFSIVIGFTVVVVALAARAFNQNNYVVFLALMISWASGIDLAHTLLYEGMNLLPFEGSNVSIQLWLLARSIQALAFLLAPMYLVRPLHVKNIYFWLFVVTGLAVWCMTMGWFPLTYVKGVGLTAFKIHAEHVIIAVLGLSALRLYLNRNYMDNSIWLGMMVVTTFTIASEFAFTQYVSLYGPANMVGHVLKILAFWGLFLALIDTSLRHPFDTLSRVASSYDALPYPIVTVSSDRKISQVNLAASQWSGTSQSQLIGQDSHVLFHDVHIGADQCPVCQALSRSETSQVIRFDTKHGTRHLECSLTRVDAEHRQSMYLQMLRECNPSRP